jgi:hypothetical protein
MSICSLVPLQAQIFCRIHIIVELALQQDWFVTAYVMGIPYTPPDTALNAS